jgi:ubiquitin C-terminal hydrolase
VKLSLEAHLTCLEVLQQIWLSVYHCLGLKIAAEHDAGKLQVKVVDRHGNELPVFKHFSPDSPSYIPNHPSLRLIDALCEDYKNQILFLTIEWGSQYTLSNGEIIAVDERKFLSFEDDQSVCEDTNGFGGAAYSRIRKGHTTVSLEDCLQAFTSPEKLDEHNAWFCFRCKKHVRAMKSLEVWRLPNVLIIHLKRFDSKNVAFGLRRDKLDTFVDFPTHNLDMSRHCAAYRSSSSTSGREDDCVVVHDKIPAEYDLFGVINHYGRMGFGHYTAFARKWNDASIDDTWTLFDDSSVSPISKESIVTAAAYVLFYRRRIFT